MKKLLVAATLCVLFQGNANACKFSWTHYGDNTLKDLVAKEIGSHITNEYCAKFNAKHELVIQSNAYTLPNMVVGHAIVGIRKKGSTSLPVETYSYVSTNTDYRTAGAANDEAVDATLSAIDNLMSELRTYKVGS